MKVKIKIDGDYQIFDYDGDLNISVITLLERLDKYCADDERSRSWAIQKAVDLFLKEKGY